MLYLPRQPLETLEDLRTALRHAIELELGTIPPYLTALFSIKPGANAVAGAIVRSVVIEEMLHLSLACNMLNAVGETPSLPAAVLRYPSPLPMGIGDKPGGPELIVPLTRLSQASIQTFMTIEEPEHPLHFPKAAALGQTQYQAIGDLYQTIGEFYKAVGQLMKELGERVFTGGASHQVTGWIDQNRLHAVLNLDDALKAIELIIEQGEGTEQSPEDESKELAHYYRFEQIQLHETLNRDPALPAGYEWGAPPVGLDDAGVWPMIKNPPEVPLPQGSEVARISDQFDGTFTLLINELQRTFGGEPGALGSAMAQMHALRIEAARLVPMEVPGRIGTAGPRFLYVDHVPGR
jgi:Ferritin-like